MTATLLPRQTNNNPPNNGDVIVDDDCGYWFDCSNTAVIVKWSIVGAILLLILLYVIIGSLHARRRMKKGLPPLMYHRWLISRSQRDRFFPPPQQPGAWYRMDPYGPPPPGAGPAAYYGNYGPAPPAYNHEEAYVPPYPGKTNPDQTFAPPLGPPPPGHDSVADRSTRDMAGGTGPQETGTGASMYSPSSSRSAEADPMPGQQTPRAK